MLQVRKQVLFDARFSRKYPDFILIDVKLVETNRFVPLHFCELRTSKKYVTFKSD